LIAEKPVNDLDDLKVRLGLPANYRLATVEKTWVDTTVFILNLPPVIVLLFLIGIGSLYLELHFPSGMFGILSALCFAVFFWSKVLGGTAGWLEVVLFALGAGCLAMEIFVVPGFGVFGVSGILMIVGAIVMSSQSWGNLESNADLKGVATTLGTFAAAIGLVVFSGLTLGRLLPRVPLFESIVLNPPNHDHDNEPRIAPELMASGTATSSLLGQRGESLSMLRPAGKARINGRMTDVVSDGPFIPEGAALEVVQVTGSRVVVRQVS
jgi:membrane-bound serine protease (ClpP class)